ncbi:MAG TPA: PadR family transcriptional regulator [Fimbriimonadaceae bacterium]|nr:PadR family transcriptional regulator [Fimbriimonadaceae bacterium]
MKRLSHLGYIALGVVAQFEPCSAYRVMMAFQTSGSSYYSGSAGAIYPLLRRLAAEGLVSVEKKRHGKRERKTYSVTKEGMAQFRRWTLTIDPKDDVAFLVDLIRTRVSLLSSFPKADRKKFFVSARQQVAAHIDDIKRMLKDGDELTECDIAAVEGVLASEEARLKWLTLIEKRLA